MRKQGIRLQILRNVNGMSQNWSNQFTKKMAVFVRLADTLPTHLVLATGTCVVRKTSWSDKSPGLKWSHSRLLRDRQEVARGKQMSLISEALLIFFSGEKTQKLCSTARSLVDGQWLVQTSLFHGPVECENVDPQTTRTCIVHVQCWDFVLKHSPRVASF